MKYLVYGSRGWIGNKLVKELQKKEWKIIEGTARVDEEKSLEDELINTKPDRIISFTGRTHGENITTIDYLEQPGKLLYNIRDNLYGPIILSNLCKKHNIHLTYLGTGCIFDYDDNHPQNSNQGFLEDDKPNFFGSSYSIVKGFTDRLMHNLFNDNVLNVRIRMPISSDDSNSNFITKITTYEKICSIPNSMTVLDEIIPIIIDMSKNEKVGTINMTNPGYITHNEILELYKKYIDPEFTWNNFSIEDQDKILSSKRSNNFLDTSKLETLYPNIKNIKDSVEHIMKIKANNKNN